MTGYGQFCAVARTQELLGGRWTLLVVRELLCGARRFGDIRRAIPRISRTILSERLQALVDAGIASRSDGAHGPEYAPTASGRELLPLVAAFGTWGQRWLPRRAGAEDLDLEPVLVDMQRRVRFASLPREPVVVRFETRGNPLRFLLLKRTEAALCAHNPGFPESVRVQGPVDALVAWWRGDADLAASRRLGLRIEGARAHVRAFPGWFERYMFADVKPAA